MLLKGPQQSDSNYLSFLGISSHRQNAGETFYFYDNEGCTLWGKFCQINVQRRRESFHCQKTKREQTCFIALFPFCGKFKTLISFLEEHELMIYHFNNLAKLRDCREFKSEFSQFHPENLPSDWFSARQNPTGPISVH